MLFVFHINSIIGNTKLKTAIANNTNIDRFINKTTFKFKKRISRKFTKSAPGNRGSV